MRRRRCAYRPEGAGGDRRLLGAGTPVDTTDDYGTSLLMQAAWNGRADLVELLLENGAIKDAQNSNGYTALMRAALKGRARAVRDSPRRGDL